MGNQLSKDKCKPSSAILFISLFKVTEKRETKNSSNRSLIRAFHSIHKFPLCNITGFSKLKYSNVDIFSLDSNSKIFHNPVDSLLNFFDSSSSEQIFAYRVQYDNLGIFVAEPVDLLSNRSEITIEIRLGLLLLVFTFQNANFVCWCCQTSHTFR